MSDSPHKPSTTAWLTNGGLEENLRKYQEKINDPQRVCKQSTNKTHKFTPVSTKI